MCTPTSKEARVTGWELPDPATGRAASGSATAGGLRSQGAGTVRQPRAAADLRPHVRRGRAALLDWHRPGRHVGQLVLGERGVRAFNQKAQQLFDDNGRRLVHVHTYVEGRSGTGSVSRDRVIGPTRSG